MARVSVAGIRTFVERSKSGAVHVGVDVHKRSYSVALTRADGVLKEWAMPSSPKAMENASGRVAPLSRRINGALTLSDRIDSGGRLQGRLPGP
jgi:hypothetical protein